MKKQSPPNNKKQEAATPIKKESEVANHPDPKIDQDFPGFPHAPAHKKNIHPTTKTEEKNAAIDEADSDGSANAFEGAEENNVLRGELDDDATDSKETY